MGSEETRRDEDEDGSSVERLVSGSMLQSRRWGDSCFVVSLCVVLPFAVGAALVCLALGGGWFTVLYVLGGSVVVPLALLYWLKGILALDRRVGPCPDCGELTTFLGPCPTCKRQMPGMPTLVNSGCVAVLLAGVLAVLVVAGVLGLSLLTGEDEADDGTPYEPPPPAAAPTTEREGPW